MFLLLFQVSNYAISNQHDAKILSIYFLISHMLPLPPILQFIHLDYSTSLHKLVGGRYFSIYSRTIFSHFFISNSLNALIYVAYNIYFLIIFTVLTI